MKPPHLDIICGWRNDQDHKPGGQARVMMRAGTRHKTRLRWYAPSREEYEAYLGRTTKVADPWGPKHAVLEILPEMEPIWREVCGFIVVAKDGNQYRVNHPATGVTFWANRFRVFTPGRYQIRDIGEYDRWSTVAVNPSDDIGSHPHVEVVDAEEAKR